MRLRAEEWKKLNFEAVLKIKHFSATYFYLCPSLVTGMRSHKNGKIILNFFEKDGKLR
jgi:hypothetical protein